MKTNTTFSHSEEAFLLSSLHEVVKVWQVGMERLASALTLKMDLQSYNLHSSLDTPVRNMWSNTSLLTPLLVIMVHGITIIVVEKDQQDREKTRLELESTRLAFSLKYQLTQLIFFYPFMEEFFPSTKMMKQQLYQVLPAQLLLQHHLERVQQFHL